MAGPVFELNGLQLIQKCNVVVELVRGGLAVESKMRSKLGRTVQGGRVWDLPLPVIFLPASRDEGKSVGKSGKCISPRVRGCCYGLYGTLCPTRACASSATKGPPQCACSVLPPNLCDEGELEASHASTADRRMPSHAAQLEELLPALAGWLASLAMGAAEVDSMGDAGPLYALDICRCASCFASTGVPEHDDVKEDQNEDGSSLAVLRRSMVSRVLVDGE